MSKYIPYPAYYDDAPVDLRNVYAAERPAGKHGFLKAGGDSFIFEDGTPGRFWGTNFNGGACFPDHEHSKKIALRLAKIGCNIVRFHQLDAEWDTPNIFKHTKGPRCAVTTELDPESMDCLDYLIHCLKEQGIYIYIDIFTYRRFKTEEGVDAATELGDAAKPYAYYNRRMIELQKKLAYDVFNHFNTYTGLSYKNDPAFVMCEIVNESDLFHGKITLEPYAGEFRKLFRAWLNENNTVFDAENSDVNTRNPVVDDFKTYLQEKYYIEMIDFMRSFGVKIPITGTNWTINECSTKSQLVTDFTDSHVYFYDWRWGEHKCMNKACSEVPDFGMACLSRSRVYEKPFFVSEWDDPWPNEYRADSSILFAAIGAMQNWGGFTIHTYAYSNRLDRMNMLGKETSAGTIGGIAYREGIFSTWNDPAKFGLFYHAALITRRGDVSCNGVKRAIKSSLYDSDLYNTASEKGRIATEYDTVLSDELYEGDRPIVDPDDGEVMSDNRQLYRSWVKKYGYIDTPRTKCVYGFLAENGKQDLDDFSVDCATDFAVIAASSLNDNPLRDTDSILLSAIGRAQNTGAVFDGDHMLEYGTAPITAEVIEADIVIKTPRSNLVIWSVNAEGFYIGKIPSEYRNGELRFSIGKIYPSIYYLIQAE